jgi:hypothetical protein
MKHLFEHLTGLLAGALAIFFVNGTVYSIVFFQAISPSVRTHLTFLDIVNLSTRIAPGLVLIVSVSIFYALLLFVQEQAPPLYGPSRLSPTFRKRIYATIEKIPSAWRKRISIAVVILPYLLVLATLIGPQWVSFYAIYENTPMKGFVESISYLFGGIISFIAGWIAVRVYGRSVLYKLFPVIAIPPLVLAITSMVSAIEAHRVMECSEPLRVIYVWGRTQDPYYSQFCLIMSLERGLLVYDRRAQGPDKTVLIPWRHLLEIRGPISARSGGGT